MDREISRPRRPLPRLRLRDRREAALRIAADDLDLLVDLSTHTKGAQPGHPRAASRRACRSRTSRAPARSASRTDRLQADRPLRRRAGEPGLPDRDAAADGRLRVSVPARRRRQRSIRSIAQRLAFAADAVVIGAFVSPLKLSRRCLALWRDVLARIPRARLAFSPVDPALRASYERLLAAAGIAHGPPAVPAAGAQRRREPGALRAGRFRARPDAIRRRQRHARGARHGRARRHAAGQAARRAHLVFDPRQPRRHRDGCRERHASTSTSRVRLATDAAFMRDVRAAIRAGLAIRR